MMNNLGIPTNFKVIGYGDSIDNPLDAIDQFGYEGLSTILADEKKAIVPTDEDKMVILLIMGDEDRATQCARSFYQAGVLTVSICTEGHHLPKDCVDSQTSVPEYMITEVAQTLLNVVFNSYGYICLDFHDLDTTLRDSGKFVAVPVHGLGSNRVESAKSDVKDYMEQIFAGSIENAIIALYFNRNSERPVVMKEIAILSTCLETLPKDINVLWGLHHDDAIKDDSVRVALILSGKTM